MIICKVIGNVWATKKEPSLDGFKLMVVREQSSSSYSMVAVDIVGAGIGEQVLVVKGSTARRAAGEDSLPVDAAIVGIIDTLELQSSMNSVVDISGTMQLGNELSQKHKKSKAQPKEKNEKK